MVLWVKHMANYHQDPSLDPQHPCRARHGNICFLCSYNKMKRQKNFPEAQEPESLTYSAVNDSKGGGKQGLIPEVALWPPHASMCTLSGNKTKTGDWRGRSAVVFKRTKFSYWHLHLVAHKLREHQRKGIGYLFVLLRHPHTGRIYSYKHTHIK